MKHYFVVNPNAGQGKLSAYEFIKGEIKKVAEKYDLDYEIHTTVKQGDGKDFTRQIGESGEEARIYACGGDGTLYEVVNGAYGYKNLEVTAVPLGSGNDFVRYFGEREQFQNLENLINGVPCEMDVIKCDDEIAINQCSMGMDAEVCAMQSKIKKYPLVTGEGAYTIGCLYAIIKKFRNRFTLTYENGETVTKDALLCVIGNASYYGGGYKAAPLAVPNDGLLDNIVLESSFSRLKLAKILGKYKKGEHLGWKETDFRRIKKLEVHTETPSAVNVDGECHFTTDASFEIVEKAIKFVLPKDNEFLKK